MVGLSDIWIAELSVSCCVHGILEVLYRADGEGVAVSLVKESVMNLWPCLDAPTQIGTLSIRQYLSGKPDASLVNGFTLQQKNKTINCAASTLRNMDRGYTVAYATPVLSESRSCSEA